MKLPKGVTAEKAAELRQRVAEVIARAQPTHIIGVDEVGYGACAGPLVIGAVCVPVDWKAPEGLTDSKMITDDRVIARLSNVFGVEVEKSKDGHVFWSLYWSHNDEIDRNGLGRTRAASIREAVENLSSRCKNVLGGKPLVFVDGNLNIDDAVSIPKADFLVPAVSMAAVMAKHARDIYMSKEMETAYPGYGFKNHVGYDVPEHRAALQKLGPCAIHRRSNNTVASHTQKSNPLTEMLLNGDFDD